MTDEEKRDWLRPIVSSGLQSARKPYVDSPRPYYTEQAEGVIDALIKSGITHELFETINALKKENTALRERLGKAMELPEYVFGCIDGKVEKIATDYLTLGELKNLEANGYSLTEEAAKERLAKFGGGNGKRV